MLTIARPGRLLILILALAAPALAAKKAEPADGDAPPKAAKVAKAPKKLRDPADKPNLVIINIDDLGYGDVGPFGSKFNRTPNIDRLAVEGRKLTSFYAAPVCSPSRSSLMTGCYPKRVLPIPGVLFPADKNGLDPSEITVAEILKKQGYKTGMVGKWHLGDQKQWLPTEQGFESYFGLPYSNDMGPVKDGVKSSLDEPLPTNSPRDKNQPPLPLLRGETVIQRVLPDDQRSLVKLYTGEALKFIRQNRKSPFFLYLAHSAVHFPIYPSRVFAGGNKKGIFSDWVEEMDWSVGQVLYAIKDLGLDKNTLVLFTSDNGGTPRSVNTPLRGFKASTWEGGVRVPTIAWWPGKIEPGTSSSQIMGMMDVLPTFARLAGGEPPSDRKIDGVDIWPVLAGKSDAKGHDSFFYYRGLVLEAVRSGPWKLHLAKGELYNLEDDIGESKNVAKDNAEVVDRLRTLADTMKDDLGLKELGPGCRHLGEVSDPQPIMADDGTIRTDMKSAETASK